MATRVKARFALVCFVFAAWPAVAMAEDTTVTLRQAVDEVRAALIVVNPAFEDEEPELAQGLHQALQELETSGVLDTPLDPLLEGTAVNFLARARLRRRSFQSADFLASPTLRALWDTVRTARNRNQGVENLPPSESRGILKRLQDDPNINEAAIVGMFRAYNRVEDLLQRQALQQTLDRLSRYKRKFGPGSVHLNGIEVGVAYLLQGVRGFGYSADDGPGPWEVVASYTTTYFSYAEDEPRVVSASEFGLRHYNFADGWGNGGFTGYIKPAHFSFGVVVAGEKDGPLVWPWSGESRTGGFFAWGEVKVAYLLGANPKWLVTRQFQILPLTF